MAEETDESAEIGQLADAIAVSVAGGDSVEGAVRRLKGLGLPGAAVDASRLSYERRVGRIRDLKEPKALVEEKRKRGYWYGGPLDEDLYWPALKILLEEDLHSDAITSIDGSSSRILGLLTPPGSPTFADRGLVLGYVQSGKTTSFMSVIAKAADRGFRLFVVLSGITDNLRAQTQERLDDMLVGERVERWYRLTTVGGDFGSPGNAANLLGNPNQRLLAVVKKNPYRLKRLVGWLEGAGAGVLAGCPILVIDDEADQASIDVGKTRRSAINDRIDQLLKPQKAAYIAYSATPFANLLIEPSYPKGLYPRDFIVDLPRSPDYFGPERLFGRDALTASEEGDSALEGLNVIREVPTFDFQLVQPPKGKGAVHSWEPTLADSLRECIYWFVLATSARRLRGTGTSHSTMLVHTSMLAAAHFKLAVPINELLDGLRQAVAAAHAPVWDELKATWDRESLAIPREDNQPQHGWALIREQIASVLKDCRVVIDNYQSTERLSYSEKGVIAIVIGGNTLSRGLTLEGLVASYFVRSATAYDTLLQMGRWFGYRKGYADLVRIWMPGELQDWFSDLATVEEEIRTDIRRYEEGGEFVTPLELAVRIRDHPKMRITSAAKMRSAIQASVSYSGSRQQTILFHHHDRDWLERNLEAGRGLVNGLTPVTSVGRTVFVDVSYDRVLQFLDDYEFHERARDMDRDLLKGYIEQQVEHDQLRTWSVAIMEHPDDSNGTVALRTGVATNLIQRSRLDIPGLPHANIKSLVSMTDRVADLRSTTAELRELAGTDLTDGWLRDHRFSELGPVGLLGLYPISRDSQPVNRPKRDAERVRLPLDAVEDVLGVCLFFPPAPKGTGRFSYVAAALPPLETAENLEDLEADLAALDAADEQAGEAADKRTSEPTGPAAEGQG